MSIGIPQCEYTTNSTSYRFTKIFTLLTEIPAHSSTIKFSLIVQGPNSRPVRLCISSELLF